MPNPDQANSVLVSLAKQSPSLELQTLDVCFLAALHLRADGGALASFQEDQLVDVFEQVCAAIEPSTESVRGRATHAIRRLREQRMLARIDGAGVVRAGEFALTRLATGIVEFFLEQEALTRESLTVLVRTLIASLTEALRAARVAGGTDSWQTGVIAPLRVTIRDLVSGIERRQRGFDLQQEQLQRDIARLLEGDWFGVVDRCQELLERTGATLRDLYQVLLRDSHEVQGVLQDIQDLAVAAGAREAEDAARQVMDQVDRVAAWGTARQRAWSEYYEYVHRYLRDVVRLDPARTLTHRLREQLAGRSGHPFALAIAAEPAMRVLRAVPPRKDPPPVRRLRKERDTALASDSSEDPRAVMEERVRGALADGALGLSSITERLTADLTTSERYLAAGRIAHTVARLAYPKAAIERPWVSVANDLAIEEWSVRPQGGCP